MKYQFKRAEGVTIIELMIAILIIGVMISYAIPAFKSSMARSRVTSNVNTMVGAINYARSEAVTRQQQVEVKISSAQWEVVVDPSGTPETIRVVPLSTSNLTTTSALTSVTFEPSGFRPLTSSSAENILIKDTETGIQRRICLTKSGNTKTTTGASC
ncbi:GspH/FimT family pseudopilin [Aliikangiella sp. IMCC44632]